MKSIRFILSLITALALAGMAIGVARGETSARKKARYMYLAGSLQKAKGNNAEAYEYYKRAYLADPTYAEGAYAYGFHRVQIPIDTLQSELELLRSLEMMRAYSDKYPDDIYESQYYGYVASQLDKHDEAIRVLERTFRRMPSATSTLLQLSDTYARADSLKGAIAALSRYEKEEGLNTQVSMQKLTYMLADKDTLGALNEVSSLMLSDPRNSDYAIIKGNLFEIIQMPDSAKYYYELAEKLNPDSGNAKMALAEFLKQSGDSVAYDNKMFEVLQCADLELDTKIGILSSYLQTLLVDKHETVRGDHLFEVLRSQYPHEPQVLDVAARYSAAKGNFADAVDQISYAIDRDPTNTIYWGQLMMYLNNEGKVEESLNTLQRASAHVEPDESMLMYYSYVAQNAGKYDLAADAVTRVIHNTQANLPTDTLLSMKSLNRDISIFELDELSQLYTQLGDIFHSDNQNDRAYLMYENALLLDDSNHLAANNYAYFLALDGKELDKALELSRKSLEADDRDAPTYLDTYAWILYKKGEMQEAEKFQELALEKMRLRDGVQPELYNHYGDIEAALEKMPRAVAAWKEALKAMEQDEDAEADEIENVKKKIKDAGTVEEVILFPEEAKEEEETGTENNN